ANCRFLPARTQAAAGGRAGSVAVFGDPCLFFLQAPAALLLADGVSLAVRILEVDAPCQGFRLLARLGTAVVAHGLLAFLLLLLGFAGLVRGLEQAVGTLLDFARLRAVAGRLAANLDFLGLVAQFRRRPVTEMHAAVLVLP